MKLIRIAFPVLAITLLLSGCKAQTTNEAQNSDLTNQQTAQTETTNQKKAFSGSITDLLKLNQPLECTFETNTEVGKTMGTAYVAGSRMRGSFDVTTTVDAEPIHTEVISDGQYSYLWGNTYPQGIKMKLDPETADSPIPTPSNESFDYNADFEYDCQPWQVDETQFAPPPSVEFMDLSARMEQLMPKEPNANPDKQSFCGACAQLEGDSKAQCLEAMGCN